MESLTTKRYIHPTMVAKWLILLPEGRIECYLYMCGIVSDSRGWGFKKINCYLSRHPRYLFNDSTHTPLLRNVHTTLLRYITHYTLIHIIAYRLVYLYVKAYRLSSITVIVITYNYMFDNIWII